MEAVQFGSEMAAPVEIEDPAGTGANSSTKSADGSGTIRRWRNSEGNAGTYVLPLVADQQLLLERPKTGVDIGGLLMEAADNPGATRFNRHNSVYQYPAGLRRVGGAGSGG